MRLWPKWYRPRRKLTVNEITYNAARLTGYTADQIRGAQRKADLVRVRFAVCLLAHRQGYSYPTIGRRLGGRDHTTIMNAVEKAEIYRQYEPEFDDFYRTLAAGCAA